MENSKLQTSIVKDILDIISDTKEIALLSLNNILIARNWLIGKRINEEILTNRSKDYGKKLILNLSSILSKNGKGFKKTDLYRYIKFFKLYPNIFPTLGKSLNDFIKQNNKLLLPWSFYTKLISIKNKTERNWYEKQILSEGWSYRVLDRNIKTDMYHRVISSQTKFNNNQLIKINSKNYLKSLMILEFLGIKQNDEYKELDLQKALEINMSKFLLELGKGYSFITKQYHLRTNDNDYYIDLVFYNTVLKRYLLIDLKVGEIKHSDIGQMLMYLDLFDEQNNIDEANKSIGMILSSDLNTDIVHYLMNNKENWVVTSKYLVYLPTKEEIRKELLKIYK